MKIKAKKPFVSGRLSGRPGDVLTVSEVRGKKLISIGVASAVKEKAAKSSEGGQTDAEGSDPGDPGHSPAPDGGAARGPSTAAR